MSGIVRITRKCMKFATKLIQHYPSHLRHAATLPWEINKIKFSADIQQIWKHMQTNCIFIAPNFVVHPQTFLFSVFKIASFSPYWLQIKYSMSLFFYLSTFVINLWHRKVVAADVTAMFLTNQCGIQQRKQHLIKTQKYTKHTQVRCVKKLKFVQLKCNLFAFSSIFAKYLQKIWIFNFPR